MSKAREIHVNPLSQFLQLLEGFKQRGKQVAKDDAYLTTYSPAHWLPGLTLACELLRDKAGKAILL
jgi:hypothetical protein